jgi:hypothetical protein
MGDCWGERSGGGEQLDADVDTRAEALAELEAALLSEEGCIDVTRRGIEHAVDLRLRQENPVVKARKFISTRVTQYHRISWVEPPEMLEVIDQFERHGLAERCSLIGLGLMMITLVRPSELRKARWGSVVSSAVSAGLKPWNDTLWKYFGVKL